MDVKPGDRIIVRWPPGRFGKNQRAYILSVPTEGRLHFQIQFEASGQKRTLTSADLEQILIKVDRQELTFSLADALKTQLSKAPKPSRPIEVGSRITIKRPDGKKKEYTLVALGQGNHLNAEIDTSVPLGASLLGAYEGDEIEVNDVLIKILKVDPPDETVVSMPDFKKRITSIDNVDLDSDKSVIIFGDPQESMIVMAPPGTGKSFTLAHKAAFFIQKKRFSPGEILILSFSREAVAEVRRRLQDFDITNVPLIQPFTIDSFAANVLLAEKPNYFFENYEKSVNDATRILTVERLGRFRHIFVDEFQDIVGNRAEFILKILEMKLCGATLMGDIEQAIYHWSLKGQESQKRSEDFLATASQTLRIGQNIRYLTRNFRINSPSLKQIAHEFRLFLEKEAPLAATDLKGTISRLSQKINGLPKVLSHGIKKYSAEIKPESGVLKCVLFRDNGQLIAESDQLRKAGIRLRVLGKYNRGLMPCWYSRLMRDFHSRAKFIAKDTEFDPWFAATDSDGWEPSDAWRLLKGIEGSAQHSKSLDTLLLRRKIQFLRDVPMSESEARELRHAGLVFSTYHASKGLEFDKVYLVEPDLSGCKDQSSFLDEARMFYVGLTRAKESIFLVSRNSVGSLYSSSYLVGRTEERRWYRNESGTRFFNVDNESDVDPASFIMPFGFISVDEVQEILTEKVREGDSVTLRLIDPPQRHFFRNYFIHWNDKPIGSMSYSFLESMKILYRRYLPLEIHATVGKKYSEFRSNPYGNLPVDEHYSNKIESWLALKLTGLAKAVR